MAETNDDSDETIVRRVLAGDEAAVGALFDRHVAQLRASVRRRLPAVVRGKVGESDVIQEAWLAAYMGIGGFEDRGDGSLAKWVQGNLGHKLHDEGQSVARVDRRDSRIWRR